MRVRFITLLAQPGHDGDAVVPEDHEAVVHVPHDARKLELENAIEAVDQFLDELAVQFGVGHGRSSACGGQAADVRGLAREFQARECRCEWLAIGCIASSLASELWGLPDRQFVARLRQSSRRRTDSGLLKIR